MSASTSLPADLVADPIVRIAADLSVIAWERMSAWRSSLGTDLDESVIDTKTSPNDLVTLADAQIESLVRGYLAAARPGDRMVGEEGAEALDPVGFFDREFLLRLHSFDPVTGRLAEVTDTGLNGDGPSGGAPGRASESSGDAPTGAVRLEWHVDPIDGTVNFVRGIEHFAFSVGVLRAPAEEVESVPAEEVEAGVESPGHAPAAGPSGGDPLGDWLVGLVASPGLGATFVAARGRGAYRVEGRLFDRIPEPIGTADTVPAPTSAKRLSGAPAGLSGRLLATGFAYKGDNRARQLAKLPALMDGYDDIRRCGSAALDLCMVAEGKVTCYAERGLGIYDYAGGALIAEEAGAFVHRGGAGGPTAAADSAEELARLVETI